MKKNRYIFNAGKAAFITIFMLVTGLSNSFAQPTSLDVGQLSIIGFNSGLANKDGFSFVCWVPLNVGTIIHFTDNGFNSSNLSTATGNYRNNEQTTTWTATSAVVAGTVVTIEGNGLAVDFVASTGSVSTINSTGTGTTGLGLANNGDQVFAFQGPVLTANNTAATFPGKLLYGVGWPGVSTTITGWMATSNAASYLPSDIAAYGLFFINGTQGAQYNGPRSGLTTLDGYKALVNDTANWLKSTTGLTPYNITAFTTGVLPLHLLSFTGQATETGNVLSWTTANEVNTAGFDIERSTDGSVFTGISSLLPDADRAYLFTDNNTIANTKYFYRLKARDVDGQFTYSSVIAINYTAKPATAYTAYPNPVAGAYLYVKPVAGNDADIQTAIIDLTGRTWYQGSARMSNGRYEISVKQLPAGAYALKISDKNGQFIQTIKFSK